MSIQIIPDDFPQYGSPTERRSQWEALQRIKAIFGVECGGNWETQQAAVIKAADIWGEMLEHEEDY